QVLQRLGFLKDQLRPFNIVTVPFPKKEINQLWNGYFIMPHMQKLNDLHGRPMFNVVSGVTFHIHDTNSSSSKEFDDEEEEEEDEDCRGRYQCVVELELDYHNYAPSLRQIRRSISDIENLIGN